jgi:hypothetical protein
MFSARSVCFALALLAAVPPARADGAFPDELAIFLPPSRPHEIVLVTNFGLLLSVDDGATFRWVCEQAITKDPLANAPVWRYQQGGDGSLYGLFSDQVAHSTDNACTWSTTQLPGDGFDLFADPTPDGRLFAIWAPAGNAAGTVLVSHDQGASFDQTLLSSPVGSLFGVESSLSSPETIYVSGFHASDGTDPAGPYLARTDDNGAHFTTWPHPEVGNSSSAFIAQVDPTDPSTVYLRVGSSVPDSLYITHDGGETWTLAFGGSSTMTAFLRSADGTLYVATRENALFAKSPDATEFERLPVPHIRCLGERDGVLYVCQDNTIDGHALAKSHDHGHTWEPVLTFNQITGLLDCPGVRQTCGPAWTTLQQTFGITGEPDAGTTPTPKTPSCRCSGASGLGWCVVGLAALVRRRKSFRDGERTPK